VTYVDRSVQARIAAVQTRLDELNAEETQLLERLQAVRATRAKSEDELRHAEQGLSSRRGVPEETWRRTVRELGTFTVSELATELDCSPATAKKHLDAMACAVPPLVKSAGRILGKAAYEYVKPDDAGRAFEAQQRLRVVPTPEQHALATALPVRDNSSVRQSLIGEVQYKLIRQVVREAVDNGWQLQRTGGGGKHLRLVKGKRRITVPQTPRNEGDMARIMRQELFGASSRRIVREANQANAG
jgi:hypothetical protein